MEWRFQYGALTRTYKILEDTVAVRPQPDLFELVRKSARSSWEGAAILDSEEEIPRSLPYAEIFEQQRWIFSRASGPILSAARTRIPPPGIKFVAEVAINENGEPSITTDLLSVQLSKDLTEEQSLAQLQKDNLLLVRQLRFAKNLFEVRIPLDRSVPDVVNDLQAQPQLYVFAEPQFLEVIVGRSAPATAGLAQQWQHTSIRSQEAWQRTRGQGIRLAVIDNAFETSHPDLKDGITSGGAFHASGNTAVFVKFGAGLDSASKFHGTFCLGMAGGRVNPDFGFRGSAPESDLIAISCLPDQVSSQTTLARAVAYAINPQTEDPTSSPAEGADVISCSLGPASGGGWIIGPTLGEAIKFAASGRGGKGTPIFWAVPDTALDLTKDGICSFEGVIPVGRSTQNELRDVGGFGRQLAFLAPGQHVYSTADKDNYTFGSGSSFAAPLAAGVGGLVLSLNPSMTVKDLRERLTSTCDQIGGVGVVYDVNGHNDFYGHGRINAERAVH